MNKHFVYLVLLALFFSDAYCLKLLVVFPMPSRSHYILGSSLGKGLAKAGHEVTMIASFAESNPPKNYKQITLSEFVENREKEGDRFNMFAMENASPVVQLFFMNIMPDLFVDPFFNSTGIQNLLKSNQKFDAVILEIFFSDAFMVLAHHYQVPLILFNPTGPTKWINNLVANPDPPSYVPDLFLNLKSDMTFFERTYNFLFGTLVNLNFYFYLYPKQASIVKKYFPNVSNFEEDIHYNISLVLLNSHESISQPVPIVPNMISIGGYHVGPPKGLPKDLKGFMDNATEGVIYFSLGSNLKPSQMPKEKKDIILKVLGSRKERVLWKWDEDNLENKPENVMISKWFPQQDILAHPNCKLFITHGGLLSTTETVDRGVPVLAFPIFGDQKINAGRAQTLGFGISLPFSSVNEKNLEETLEELLTNPKYRENAKLRSKLIHDRPVKPMDLAEYWIRYVVEHKGAPHLSVAGIKLPLYKYLMLDVIGFLLGAFLLVIYLILKLCRRIKCKSSAKRDIVKKTQ